MSFSKGVEESMTNMLSNLPGFQKVQNLEHYVGITLRGIGALSSRGRSQKFGLFYEKTLFGQSIMAIKSVVWLPNDLIQLIVGIPPRHPFEGFDRLSWHHTSTGAFSIKSYEFSIEEQLTRGWTFLNTDGAVQMESGDATVGRIMCDEKEDWVFGYNRFIGKCSIFYAELWGILDGLKLIQRRDHDKVIIESDNLE
ncbi:hypothetical protein Goarm_013125, partial [Gossypium armourianum]|nr:hypothetical protein [Gossypium armourianum]